MDKRGICNNKASILLQMPIGKLKDKSSVKFHMIQLQKKKSFITDKNNYKLVEFLRCIVKFFPQLICKVHYNFSTLDEGELQFPLLSEVTEVVLQTFLLNYKKKVSLLPGFFSLQYYAKFLLSEFLANDIASTEEMLSSSL